MRARPKRRAGLVATGAETYRHTIADLEGGYTFTQRGDRSGHLMAQDDRIVAEPVHPRTIDDRAIGMAHTRGLDIDNHPPRLCDRRWDLNSCQGLARTCKLHGAHDILL